jgi:hypothetical protein
MGTIPGVLARGKQSPAETVVRKANAQKTSAPHPRSGGASGPWTAEFVFERLAGMLGRLTEGDREFLLRRAQQMANR